MLTIRYDRDCRNNNDDDDAVYSLLAQSHDHTRTAHFTIIYFLYPRWNGRWGWMKENKQSCYIPIPHPYPHGNPVQKITCNTLLSTGRRKDLDTEIYTPNERWMTSRNPLISCIIDYPVTSIALTSTIN